MFFNLMENQDIFQQYDYAFIMEPDTNPIRKAWLDILRIECQMSVHHPFWMKGSIYVGGKYVDDSTNTPWYTLCLSITLARTHNTAYRLYHINGNALYNIGDAAFREFLAEVKKAAGVGNAYDISIYEYRRAKFTRHQKIIHKFIYAPFILNYGVSGYSLSAVRKEKPETFLIHKKRGCEVCDPIVA